MGEWMTNRTRGTLWLAFAVLSLLAFFIHPLANMASHYLREIMVQSGSIYGTLRVMTAALSVVEDADFSAGVGVASTTVSPGQLFQPISNTVGRLADLIFNLTIASGILTFTLPAIAKIASIGLAFVAAAHAYGNFTSKRLSPALYRLVRSVLVISFFGSILLPMSFVLANIAGNTITDNAMQEVKQVFKQIDEQFKDTDAQDPIATSDEPQLADSAAIQPTTIWGQLGTAVDTSTSAVSNLASSAKKYVLDKVDFIGSKVSMVENFAANSPDLFLTFTNLAIAYIMKILVLPVLIVLSIAYLMRSALKASSRDDHRDTAPL